MAQGPGYLAEAVVHVLALGEGLSIIGLLLGHRSVETTAPYAHLA